MNFLPNKDLRETIEKHLLYVLNISNVRLSFSKVSDVDYVFCTDANILDNAGIIFDFYNKSFYIFVPMEIPVDNLFYRYLIKVIFDGSEEYKVPENIKKELATVYLKMAQEYKSQMEIKDILEWSKSQIKNI